MIRPFVCWFAAVFLVTCLLEALLWAEMLPHRLETLALVIPAVVIHKYVWIRLDSGSMAVSVALCGVTYGLVFWAVHIVLDAAASVRTRSTTIRWIVIPSVLFCFFLMFVLLSPPFELK